MMRAFEFWCCQDRDAVRVHPVFIFRKRAVMTEHGLLRVLDVIEPLRLSTLPATFVPLSSSPSSMNWNWPPSRL